MTTVFPHSIQDFFRYTEAKGTCLFEEFDRDGDGLVTIEYLKIVMRKRKLPRRYARDLFRHTRSNLFSKSIGWKQFLTFMEQKELAILRAYTTLCLSKSGTLEKNQILTSLRSAGLLADEANAVAMMRYLNAYTDESISYSHFRNFMLLLPSERLEEDPRSIWFEAATLVAVPPPVEIPTESVLKSTLAGGLASALSTYVMYPIDMKTRVQASTLSFPELMSKLPEIGIQGLYRGSIPVVLGQFSSHGLRTGIFEASKLILVNVAPTLPDIQVQSMASFCSMVLGTVVRIPCEVLKQRLQACIFNNVGEAIIGTLQQDGLKGFFRGTGATLCREVPFYVDGMGLYAEAKKAAQSLLNRDLKLWGCVFNNFDVDKIIADMLKSLKMSRPSLDTFYAFQKNLKYEIISRGFLLVLDDLWDEEEERNKTKWENMLASLSCGIWERDWLCAKNSYSPTNWQTEMLVHFKDSRVEPPHLDWGKALHVVI